MINKVTFFTCMFNICNSSQTSLLQRLLSLKAYCYVYKVPFIL